MSYLILLNIFLVIFGPYILSPSYTNNGRRNGCKFDFELIVRTYYKHPRKIQRAPRLKLV